VGLSLGITGSLTTASKLVVIVIMFVGRVSMLSIMVAVFKNINFGKSANQKDKNKNNSK